MANKNQIETPSRGGRYVREKKGGPLLTEKEYRERQAAKAQKPKRKRNKED